jgi:hypothetical protein
VYKLLMHFGVIQETKILDIEEADVITEMNQQIEYLISRNLSPEIILADPKAYAALVAQFDMTKSYGLHFPGDMGGVRVQNIYVKKVRMAKQAIENLDTIVRYAAHNSPYHTRIEVKSGDKEIESVEITWLTYKGIDLIVCPWVEGVMVLPALYKDRSDKQWRIP